MKKVLLSISILFFVIVIVLSSIFIFKGNSKTNDILGEYININELSDEFMDKYYSDMDKLTESGNLDNVLLVVSKERPNDYGATMIIEAPNSTYILEYKDEYERDSAKEKFENDKSILSVTENTKFEFSDVDTSGSYNSWGVEKAGLNHAIEYINQHGGESVNVAIIDTGCDMNLFNQSYEGKITEVYNMFLSDTYGTDVMFDHYGHGTHIAGTIAEATPSNVKIIPFKISDNEGLDLVIAIQAINYITKNHKADVINMSFGHTVSRVDFDALYFSIEAARRENIISVAAAGNSCSSDIDVPAAYNNTISIGAVDSELRIAEFSTFNEYVTFTAPGVNINSINGILSGTSMATPHAVSAVAFLKSIKKNLSFEETITALKQNSIDLGTTGRDDYYGYGFIDLSSFSLCDNNNVSSCTSFEEKEDFVPTRMEIESVAYTSYNYGSLTNIMPTEVRLTDGNDKYKIIRLDRLEDIEITGYSPYATGEQTLTLKYRNLEKTFKVTNPENYEIGWVYQIYEDDMGNKRDYYSISGYKDNNLQLEKLYFPETIEGNVIHSIDYINWNYIAVFGNSNDAKYYKEVYLPSNIKIIGESIFSSFDNLSKVISDADELEVGRSAFSGTKFLSVIDANIKLGQSSSSAFFNNYSLKEIKLSNNTTIIPDYAFYNCKFLEKINFPEGLTEIGGSAFRETSLYSIELPNSLQKISHYAFHGTLIEEVYIPSNVTSIGQSSFSGLFLNRITVDPNNTIYDSRNNSNAIIRTEDNTLIVGSNKATIPGSVKEIAEYAFYGSYITDIEIPEGVETIGSYAFADCLFLKTVKMSRSINSIADDSFKITVALSDDRINYYVYNSSYAHNFVSNKLETYILRDVTPNPPQIINRQYIGDIDYLPYQTLNISSYKTRITYLGIDEVEIVSEFHDPKYQGGRDSFRYGDWSAWLYYDTAQGYHNLELEIPVWIGKLTPEYEIPTDVYANVNSTLADVDLPDGFKWEDDTILLTELGNVVYDAIYTPKDTNNYEIVEHIAIPIHVINKTLIKPTITVRDKEYDGTSNYPINYITITGINTNDYTIKEVIFDRVDAGEAELIVKLRLSDEKAVSYSFSNGKQEKDYKFVINVLPIIIQRPNIETRQLTYNGEYQSVLITNFDSNTMNIEGNIAKDVGVYYVTVSLKDKVNTIWDYGNSADWGSIYEITKADIDYTASDTEAIYDGNQHGINIEVTNENAAIKYRDSNGEYTLDEMPKYTDIGTYTIGYKISIDDNYNEVIGENTLTIIDHGIINNTEDVEVVYDGNNHTITLDLNVDNYTAHYSINNTDYDLDTLPQFKEAGEYTINYRIDKEGYDSITGSNKVKIYGISELDPSLLIKDNNLIVSDKTFDSITNKITIYSKTAEISHLDSEDNEVTRNEIKTGDKIHIRINNTATLDYNISLLGDIDEDGVTSIRDMYQVFLLYKNKSTGLTPVQIAAADFNNDGRITIMDLYHVYLKMKGKE